MVPCLICDTEGINFVLSVYLSRSSSELDWLMMFEGHPPDHEGFKGVNGPPSHLYFCSEECTNFWILKNNP
jgi:hypothetical protein